MSARRKRVAAFLKLAEEELAAARLLAQEAPRQAAYLCQQSAEKTARAILTDANVPFGTGHNLSQMADALGQDHPWASRIRALDKHSPAATRFRYPSAAGRLYDPPSSKHLRRDADELADVLEEAQRFLATDEQSR